MCSKSGDPCRSITQIQEHPLARSLQITVNSLGRIKKLGPQTDGGKEAEIAAEKKRPQL